MNLTPEQTDALKELINIGVCLAAGILNQMINTRIHLQVPFIRIFSSDDPLEDINGLNQDKLAMVRLGFKGPLSGTAALAFPTESASKLVAVLAGEDSGTPGLDSVSAGTLNEVGNIVINGVMGSIGNVIKKRIEYSIPSYKEDTLKGLLRPNNPDPNATVLLAGTRFAGEELQIEGDIILLFEAGSFSALLEAMETITTDSG